MPSKSVRIIPLGLVAVVLVLFAAGGKETSARAAGAPEAASSTDKPSPGAGGPGASGPSSAAEVPTRGKGGDAPKPDRAPEPGQAPGVWFPGSDGLYVPPFFDSFRGIDLSDLTPPQKERFLHWVNTEYCTCAQTGCNRDTIANCYTNDTACPRAPVRIRQILELVKGGARVPGSAQPPIPAAPPKP